MCKLQCTSCTAACCGSQLSSCAYACLLTATLLQDEWHTKKAVAEALGTLIAAVQVCCAPLKCIGAVCCHLAAALRATSRLQQRLCSHLTPVSSPSSVQVWHNNEEGELVVEPTQGLRVVLGKRAAIEAALNDAKYHRIIHVRNAAVAALREVRTVPSCCFLNVIS